MFKRILLGLALALSIPVAAAAQSTASQTTPGYLTTSGCPSGQTVCFIQYGSTVPVSGTITTSVNGWTPNGNYTTLTATASSSASTALPSGTVVAFQNSSNNDVSCVLATGSATATTNKIIVHGSATVFLTVGSNVNTACINQTGSASNVIVLAGGDGFGTNFGPPLSSQTVAQATAANLNATVVGSGSAGSAASGVLTVQGIASMTPVQTTWSTTAASPTDRSGTLTTGGTSQTLASSNASRKCLLIQNPVSASAQNIAAAEDLYINNNNTAAVVGSGANFADLAPGASASLCFSGIVDQTTITVNASTTGHRWYAKEY